MNGIIAYILSLKRSKSYTDSAINALPKGVIYKGEVATVNDLPEATSFNVGWMYSVLENNHDYVSTGASWHDQDYGNYHKPDTGIPKSDLSEEVKTTLDSSISYRVVTEEE